MVVGATGHQNIPASAVASIQARVDELIGQIPPPLTGVAALAVGADQLIAEAIRGHGGELHVVIPSRGYEITFDGPDRERYARLLDAADEVETLDFSHPSEDAFLAAGIRVVDLADLLVAIWDGQPAQGRGGTADVVAYAEKVGKRVEVIWPDSVVR